MTTLSGQWIIDPEELISLARTPSDIHGRGEERLQVLYALVNRHASDLEDVIQQLGSQLSLVQYCIRAELEFYFRSNPNCIGPDSGDSAYRKPFLDAEDLAKNLGHSQVGPDHLLTVLSADGLTAKALNSALGLTYDALFNVLKSNSKYYQSTTQKKVSLKKGERMSLADDIRLARVGLGWDVNKYEGDDDFDLDASAFMLNASSKVTCDEDFVYYNNLRGRNDAVLHMGDNLVGGGDGEVIVIDFEKMPSNIEKIAVTVTIHEAAKKNQSFGMVSNAYVRVAKLADESDENGIQLLRFDLEQEFSSETSVVVCELYRKNGHWRFNAVAGGVAGGLDALCGMYGVEITD